MEYRSISDIAKIPIQAKGGKHEEVGSSGDDVRRDCASGDLRDAAASGSVPGQSRRLGILDDEGDQEQPAWSPSHHEVELINRQRRTWRRYFVPFS